MSYRASLGHWPPAVLLSLILISCGGAESEPEPVVRPVRYQQVFSTGGNRVRAFSGIARAGVESRLSFKVSGTVRQVAVAVGDSVRAGQLIAQLDPEDFRLQAQQAQASLTQARARERSARADYLRARQLYENNSISLSELDAARAASESAESTVRLYDQALELARLQLSYTSLTAPIDGAVAAVSVEQNENVQQGQSVVLLTSGSQLEVEVAVPEVLISQVREGSEVRVRLDALPDRRFDAVVTEVGVAATGAGMTYPVRVRLRESDPDIRSGMAAEVDFLFQSSDQRVLYLVPPAAVGEDREGRFVYVAEPTEGELAVVRRRPVEIGELIADGLEILEGLDDGDRVITAGWSKIEDGMTVRLSI
ncbi:MAG: efflux RND transporter periplasmic adaptor subunit [Gemmatimonadota bacterium]|nr:MAG: efflux RND transporter periplasmic adaptor subunit [Gemmatimonadota bacterium]